MHAPAADTEVPRWLTGSDALPHLLPGGALRAARKVALSATCAALGQRCGETSDGCGGTLRCGVCPAEQARVASTRAFPDAQPLTCHSSDVVHLADVTALISREQAYSVTCIACRSPSLEEME
ncbi:hypothetical protein MYSTI_07386 [Myxococcus stipitatus DSM 14675]|uniref:Uncharacterized protein n=1 Tax=Myxococcus stipitatus (strain DSM 14675 / JCM 12634 / Mx s8) TaxID=1278073 RepID=L7UKV6_MYXSD|nr:hypothetical protein MYSTI_07386 [Myxococcus stipitatus DSM 14675]